jgi:uncharacterized damage-inducible protein DinB
MTMAIRDALLPEFDHEMKTTRSLLAIVPQAQAGWKPHAKSMALGELAMHIATVPFWGTIGLTRADFDTAPPGGPKMEVPPFTTTEALVGAFDASVADCRAALAATDDAAFGAMWSLKRGGQVLMTMPRTVIMRSFVMNHLIHHRGQLSVYLRLLDVKLPPIYGPTADDQAGFGG